MSLLTRLGYKNMRIQQGNKEHTRNHSCMTRNRRMTNSPNQYRPYISLSIRRNNGMRQPGRQHVRVAQKTGIRKIEVR